MTSTYDHEPVRYFDYRPRYRVLKREIDEAIQSVLDSGVLILGPQVEAFESEFAAFTGAPHAVTVASGSDAIELALRALDIGPGDEVITVSHTAVATIAAIRSAGAIPRFVDIQPDTLLMNPSLIEESCDPRTRAIIAVHLYGNPVPMEQIRAVADRRKLLVIEDCAQAFGTEYAGRHVGSFGDIGCFSFYPTKNLGAFGDGGACVTSSAEIAERLRKLRMYGFSERDGHSHLEGTNSRLDELQAAILRVKLHHIEGDLSERRRLAGLYQNGLQGAQLVLPVQTKGGRHSYHLFVVRTPRREATVELLNQERIGFGIHYPIPAHLMEAYHGLPGQPVNLPETEKACGQILSLPLYPGLQDEEVLRVCSVLNRR